MESGREMTSEISPFKGSNTKFKLIKLDLTPISLYHTRTRPVKLRRD